MSQLTNATLSANATPGNSYSSEQDAIAPSLNPAAGNSSASDQDAVAPSLNQAAGNFSASEQDGVAPSLNEAAGNSSASMKYAGGPSVHAVVGCSSFSLKLKDGGVPFVNSAVGNPSASRGQSVNAAVGGSSASRKYAGGPSLNAAFGDSCACLSVNAVNAAVGDSALGKMKQDEDVLTKIISSAAGDLEEEVAPENLKRQDDFDPKDDPEDVRRMEEESSEGVEYDSEFENTLMAFAEAISADSDVEPAPLSAIIALKSRRYNPPANSYVRRQINNSPVYTFNEDEFPVYEFNETFVKVLIIALCVGTALTLIAACYCFYIIFGNL